jgi:hypothetical protein
MSERFDRGEADSADSSHAAEPGLVEGGAEITVEDGEEGEIAEGEGEGNGSVGGAAGTGLSNEAQELDDGDEYWADEEPEVVNTSVAEENPEAPTEELSEDDDEDWEGEDPEIVNDRNGETERAPDDESLVDEDEDWAGEDAESERTGETTRDTESRSSTEENSRSDDDDEDWAGEEPGAANPVAENVEQPPEAPSKGETEDGAVEGPKTPNDPNGETGSTPDEESLVDEDEDEEWASDDEAIKVSGGTPTPELSPGAENSLESDDSDGDWAGEDPRTVHTPGQEKPETATGEPLVDRDEDSRTETNATPAEGHSDAQLGGATTVISEVQPRQNGLPETSPRPDEPGAPPQPLEPGRVRDQISQNDLPKELGVSAAPQEVAKAVGDASAVRAIESVSGTSQQIETVKEKTLTIAPLSAESQRALRENSAAIVGVEGVSSVTTPVRPDSVEHAKADLAANETRVEAAVAAAARQTGENLEAAVTQAKRGSEKPPDKAFGAAALETTGSSTRSLEDPSKVAYYLGEHITHGKEPYEDRGWTPDSIRECVDNPVDIYETTDYRFNKTTGQRNSDDPSTAYVQSANRYVVVNDETRDVVQVSDRNKPGWGMPTNWIKK